MDRRGAQRDRKRTAAVRRVRRQESLRDIDADDARSNVRPSKCLLATALIETRLLPVPAVPLWQRDAADVWSLPLVRDSWTKGELSAIRRNRRKS
jgi:hypothetical protein